MVRKVTVTAEQVNAAADALKADGIKPTSRAIRDSLGNAASLGTINRFLQRWKGGQLRMPAPPRELPAEVRLALLDYVEQQVSASQALLEVELSEQQQEGADLASENENQLDTIDTLTAELEAALEEAARERQVSEQARTELAKAKLRLEGMPRLEKAAEDARMELAKAQFRLEDIPRLEEAAELARTELFQSQLQLEAMHRLEADLALTREELELERHELSETRAELEEERDLRIKAQQFIVDPIFKKQA